MLPRSSIAAALATAIVTVPAAWHWLDADIQADGPKIRPAAEVLHLDGADVSLQLDRGAQRTGAPLSAVLVASADTPHQVTVDLATFEDMGIGEERVPNPPLRVDHRKLTLQAAPGGGPPVVATLTLGKKHDKPGSVSWYDMYLTPHGVEPPRHSWDGDSGAAHAGFATWSGNSFPIAIEPPATIPAEGPFTIAVRVTNTTKKGFTYCEPQVGGTIQSYEEMGGGLQLGSDDYDIAQIDEPPTSGDDANELVPVGAERVMIFRITPKHPGVKHFTIVAHVSADGGGAMDIASFDRPEVADAVAPTLAAR